MSKKIIFNTINESALTMLSNYNVAYWELRSLSDTFKAEKKAITEKMDKLCEERKQAIANGMSTDDAIRQFDLVPLNNELRVLSDKYAEDCKPHKDAKKVAMGLISDDLYYGYLLSVEKGSVDITSGKVCKGKKTIEISKSYKAMCKDFVEYLGASKTDNETAMNKFAQLMSIRTNGMKKCNKGDDYVNAKSASQYKELFMLNLLQYLVNDLGVLVQSEDHTLSMKQYDAE